MDQRQGMDRAVELAAATPDPRPNPRVGCVLLDPTGRLLGEGAHIGPGRPHAEVAALRNAVAAGESVRGATAIVTLEPCNHHGRTGPCSEALIDAGIARVVIAQRDPNPLAAGGAERLRAAGVEVTEVSDPEVVARVAGLNEIWTRAVSQQRPVVTWKAAATLDGRIAAADGSSRWITSPAARAQTHQLRAEVDAVLVGSGTLAVDDPELTVRPLAAEPEPEPGFRPDVGAGTDPESGRIPARQPLRVVMGRSVVPPDARIRTAAPTDHFRHLATRDPAVALRTLFEQDVHHVLLEGGPTLAAAFLEAGLIDRIRWYVAPKLLGAGACALAGIGVTSIAEAQDWSVVGLSRVGPDVRIDLVPTGQRRTTGSANTIGR